MSKASPLFGAAHTTGVGSMPGVSARESVDIACGEFDVPFLPELPARGPGSDMVGRALGLLSGVATEFAASTTPTGWRISGAVSDSGAAMRRARSFLGEDLDAAQERLEGHRGAFKIAVAGPWTVASQVELANGERLLRDFGARRDLAAALAHGVADYVAMVANRLPHARIIVQVDEPMLPAVLAGRVKTQSGLHTYRTVHPPEATAALRGLVEAVDVPVVGHCCADDHNLAARRAWVAAGMSGFGWDMNVFRQAEEEFLGEQREAGRTFLCGVMSAVDASPRPTSAVIAPVLEMASRLGMSSVAVADSVVLTPSCGMAGASPTWVRHVATALRRAGAALRDERANDVYPQGKSFRS